jgi:WD40 repeat protein
MLLIKPDRDLGIVDLASGKQISKIFTSHEITAAAFSPDARLIATGASNGQISVWDNSTMSLFVPSHPGHSSAVRRIAFSPDSLLLASGSDDATVRVWLTNDGSPVGEPIVADSAVVGVAFSPDGQRLIITSQKGSLYVFDTQKRQVIH